MLGVVSDDDDDGVEAARAPQPQAGRATRTAPPSERPAAAKAPAQDPAPDPAEAAAPAGGPPGELSPPVSQADLEQQIACCTTKAELGALATRIAGAGLPGPAVKALRAAYTRRLKELA